MPIPFPAEHPPESYVSKIAPFDSIAPRGPLTEVDRYAQSISIMDPSRIVARCRDLYASRLLIGLENARLEHVLVVEKTF